MSPSTNTHSGSTASKETLAVVFSTSHTSPCLSKSDLNNIHNDIKSITEKYHSDMKAFNDHIYAMLINLTDTSSNTDKQEEQLTEISSKLSIDEERLEKLSIKETQI